MTIESQLERIAVSLERFVALAEGRQSTPQPELPPPESPPAESSKPRKPRKPTTTEQPEDPPPSNEENDDFLKDDAPEEVTVTKEQVIDALSAYGQAAGSTDTARALMLKVGGAKKIGELSKDKYAAVLKAANEAAAKLKK